MNTQKEILSKEKILTSDNYNKPQIILQSDRLIFNSVGEGSDENHEGGIGLFAKDTIEIKSNENAHKYFGLDSSKKTILVLGGSLGATNINEGVLNNISLIREYSYQVIWQTGKFYYKNILSKNIKNKKIIIKDFINRMDLAYSVSDIIISRAGAIAISELCVISKPLILVPSPNVVDDHQTKNAKAISEKGGCVLIKDSDAKNTMLKTAFDLFENKSKMDSMKKSLSKLSSPNATQKIVNKIYEII